MRKWLQKHRIVARLLYAVLALAAVEGILLYYYLSSWANLPAL
jgi:hypothetical protein